jgi:predicted site-specific integrase-resolvase
MGNMKLLKLDFVPIRNIGSYCGVSRITVKRWIDKGQLRSIKLPSGHNRVTIQDFKIFLNENHLPVPRKLLDIN